MKFLKAFLGIIFLYFFLIASIGPISGCKKTEIIHDTTIHNVHDTAIHNVHDTSINNIHDSTFVTDSVFDLINGLVAYYNFNGGNLNDSSGFGNHIIFNNATQATDRFGNANNAYAFNGINNYMQVTSNSSLNPDNVTIFAIVKIKGFSRLNCHANQIVGKGYPDYINGFYALRVEDQYPCGGTVDSAHEFFDGVYGDNNPQGTGAEAATDSIAVQKDQWYSIAFTFDGLRAKLYINSVLKDSRPKTIEFNDNSHDLFIGRHEDPLFPYWFNGVIDEIRIYNRALPVSTLKLLNNLKN